MSSTSTMFYFFFNDTATTEIYTLSLHDALPIWWRFGALYAISVLGGAAAIQLFGNPGQAVGGASTAIYGLLGALAVFMVADRKSTRLNSSHANISYAVFCLKKKKTTQTYTMHLF